eukprot:2928356-Amphidinium_carterae.2
MVWVGGNVSAMFWVCPNLVIQPLFAVQVGSANSETEYARHSRPFEFHTPLVSCTCCCYKQPTSAAASVAMQIVPAEGS